MQLYRFLFDIPRWTVREPRPTKKLLGEHTWMDTPVPIPNTAVKHPGPMVVCSHARVGNRRIIDKARWPKPAGFLFCHCQRFLVRRSLGRDDDPMNAQPLSFSAYQQQAISFAEKILRQGSPGEYDEQALPAYSHRNRLMRWLFWQRLRRVLGYFDRKVRPGARVLDFGCGVGMLLPLLAWRHHHVTGVDLDIRNTNSFLDAFHIHNVTILPADRLGELPRAHFDVITALDVLEHVPHLDETVARLGELLSPEGKLIVCGPTENTLYRLGRRLACFSGA